MHAPALHSKRAGELASDGKRVIVLRREVSEDVFFVLGGEICPHPHMANHSASEGWRQLLGSSMAPATVRIKFPLTYVRLLGGIGFCGLFGGRGRLNRCWGLSQNMCRADAEGNDC
jgi:hypothetical protein